jgi:hypothetical protein
MFGSHRKGQEEPPQALHISIARYRSEMPRPYADNIYSDEQASFIK